MVNGFATDERAFRDEFFTDVSIHDPRGENVMIFGVEVLPKHRGRGLASALMRRYLTREAARGRKHVYLTCHASKVGMYRHMGYEELGVSASVWGGSEWREMACVPGKAGFSKS